MLTRACKYEAWVDASWHLASYCFSWLVVVVAAILFCVYQSYHPIDTAARFVILPRLRLGAMLIPSWKALQAQAAMKALQDSAAAMQRQMALPSALTSVHDIRYV